MMCHFNANHYLSVCCCPGSSALYSRQEHFMAHYGPIFKLEGGGLCLLVGNFFGG